MRTGRRPRQLQCIRQSSQLPSGTCTRLAEADLLVLDLLVLDLLVLDLLVLDLQALDLQALDLLVALGLLLVALLCSTWLLIFQTKRAKQRSVRSDYA